MAEQPAEQQVSEPAVEDAPTVLSMSSVESTPAEPAAAPSTGDSQAEVEDNEGSPHPLDDNSEKREAPSLQGVDGGDSSAGEAEAAETNEEVSPEEASQTLLEHLDERQNEVLTQLDELNTRIESLIQDWTAQTRAEAEEAPEETPEKANDDQSTTKPKTQAA